MKGEFLGGLALGLLVGVVVIAYSKDAQKMVEKGKKTVEKKIDEMKKGKKPAETAEE